MNSCQNIVVWSGVVLLLGSLGGFGVAVLLGVVWWLCGLGGFAFGGGWWFGVAVFWWGALGGRVVCGGFAGGGAWCLCRLGWVGFWSRLMGLWSALTDLSRHRARMSSIGDPFSSWSFAFCEP